METYGMNVFQYAAACERMFEANTFHERKTTFFSDLSIAEYVSGSAGVIDTFNNVVKSWLDNEVYFSEFVVCLNHKIWQHYEKDEKLASIYNTLWEKAEMLCQEAWKDDQKKLAYYFEITD